MKSLSIKHLIETLDYWIFIGIDSDIYQCTDQRPEFKHLVIEARSKGIKGELITPYVMARLKEESEKPLLFTKTFWRLFVILLKNKIGLK